MWTHSETNDHFYKTLSMRYTGQPMTDFKSLVNSTIMSSFLPLPLRIPTTFIITLDSFSFCCYLPPVFVTFIHSILILFAYSYYYYRFTVIPQMFSHASIHLYITSSHPPSMYSKEWEIPIPRFVIIEFIFTLHTYNLECSCLQSRDLYFLHMFYLVYLDSWELRTIV